MAAEKAFGQAKRRGALKAVISFRGGSLGPPMDKDYRAEEKKRIKSEIAELNKRMANFDEKKEAAEVRKALDLEARRKQLRLEELELEQ